MRRRGEKTLEILKTLGEAALTTVDLLFVLAQTPYGASLRTLEITHERVRAKRRAAFRSLTDPLQERQRFLLMISHLKRDGLIVQHHRRAAWSLTEKGRHELTVLKKQHGAPLPQRSYAIHQAHEWVVVAFDIPERERKKRAWLRAQLVAIGFSMLQQSVWTGHVAVPATFIDDLKYLGLLSHVEIFALSRQGTLRRLKSS